MIMLLMRLFMQGKNKGDNDDEGLYQRILDQL
jgi:hypothetical protein